MPLICTQGACDTGELLVEQFQTYWKRYAFDGEAGEEIAYDIRERFSAASTSIIEKYNEVKDRWKTPFDADCCVMQELGRQAYELNVKLAKLAGVEPPIDMGLKKPGEETNLGDILKVAVYAAIAVGVIISLPYVIPAVKDAIKEFK